jgi:hypothetical protein
MKPDERRSDHPQITEAVAELCAMIQARYPSATFDVFEHDDPAGVHLRAVIDVEDTDEVVDTVIETLTQMQTERALPIYLLIEQPLERVAEQLKTRAGSRTIEPLSALFR